MTKNSTRKYNTIDLFAGCGGLIDGFEQAGSYKTLACVEWEKEPCRTLSNRLKARWGYKNANKMVLRFDIQRDKELFQGWDDPEYGKGIGIDKLVGKNNVDVVVGGPPCQAYSIAGRIRDDNGMKKDYRNYLFESYAKVVERYSPKIFVFENVFGILSSKPDGNPVVDDIKKSFKKIGYEIINDIRKYALFNITDYGIPQNRSRVILVGLRSDSFDNPQDVLVELYTKIIPLRKEKAMTARDAIADLPVLEPLKEPVLVDGKKISHKISETHLNHFPRFHSSRDMLIFRELAYDAENGNVKYPNTIDLRRLYTEFTGKKSNVHKYNVIKWDKPSNTIVAHLCKDGLRHIHPDPKQARTITVREAARLQTFDDDFEFLGSITAQYKMVGNAVPPKFAKKIAEAMMEVLEKAR